MTCPALARGPGRTEGQGEGNRRPSRDHGVHPAPAWLAWRNGHHFPPVSSLLPGGSHVVTRWHRPHRTWSLTSPHLAHKCRDPTQSTAPAYRPGLSAIVQTDNYTDNGARDRPQSKTLVDQRVIGCCHRRGRVANTRPRAVQPSHQSLDCRVYLMSLEAELEEYRRHISTDAYPMSIGEIVNLYRDGELDIHPEFQRLFRWSPNQRTRLIESILLGIPLPSIFVAAGEEGWDVVDGVQRLSTILHFMGLLKGEDGQLLPPFECEEAPFLKSLKGVKYETDGKSPSLTQNQRIDFKRARLDIKIIKRQSDKRAKYDLFQRLNSYGSVATEQELRNSLLISLSKTHFDWLLDLSDNENFKSALSLPERLLNERYHMEIALRFVTIRRLPESRIRKMGYLGEFLTSEIIPVTEKSKAVLRKEAQVFGRTFQILHEAGGADILRKWSATTGRPEGPFSATAFEVLALGVGYHEAAVRITPEVVIEKRKSLWENPAFAPGSSTGIRADQRMRKTVPHGRLLFS